jgi:hypothetical protein
VKRRIAEIGVGYGLNTVFTNSGDDITTGPNEGRTGTLGSVTDADGARSRISTVSTSDDYNYIYGRDIWRRAFNPNFYCRFKISSNTSIRIFIGLTNQTPDVMTNADAPAAGHYAGLFLNGGSSKFQFKSRDGSTVKSTDDIAKDTAVHDFYMWLKKASGGDQVIYQLDNGPRQYVSLNPPGDSTSLFYVAAVRTTATGTKSVEIGKIHIDALY